MSEPEDVNTYTLIFEHGDEVRAIPSPFGMFTAEDLKRMGIISNNIQGDTNED